MIRGVPGAVCGVDGPSLVLDVWPAWRAGPRMDEGRNSPSEGVRMVGSRIH